MVVSKLDKSISYPERRGIDPKDNEMESDLYEIDVNGVDIIIAVGNPNNTFEDKNIIFFPIYLVQSDESVVQIGLYEIHATDISEYYHDSELNVEKMNAPLLYSFVSKQMLEDLRLVPTEDMIEEGEAFETFGKEDEEVQEIPEFRRDVFTLTTGVPIARRLKEETKSDAKKEKGKYSFKKGETWVNTFMENPNYYIVDNEGGGDCLFATIRDAFAQFGMQTTVQKLRKKLAGEATQELFMNYKQQYEEAKTSIVTDTANIKQLEIEYEKYRKLFSETLDRNLRKEYTDATNQIIEQREKIINEKTTSQKIANEYAYMKNVSTLEQFQKLITTCEFWGETWALSTLERILRIKFILLSSENWRTKDLQNVITCGQLNDAILQQQGEFKPDYYLMLDYSGFHYKLVGYKSRQIFTFPEIPYEMKRKIVEKCMEKNAGLFSLIPDFVDFSNKIRQESPSHQQQSTPTFDELSESKIRGLYDDDIQFIFYKSSADKMPGKGSNEKLAKELMREFSQLASLKNWRKKLDNTWTESQFTLDGHQWNSVEHFYQANKFRDSPDFYLSFTAESGTKLSKNPDYAKAATTTTGKLKGEHVRPSEVRMDANLQAKDKKKSLQRALEAKFTQNEELKRILLETKNAKLMHYRKSKEPELAEELMMLREELKKRQ